VVPSPDLSFLKVCLRDATWNHSHLKLFARMAVDKWNDGKLIINLESYNKNNSDVNLDAK